MDTDLSSIQEARTLVTRARDAFSSWHAFDQDAVDHVVREMARAGEKAAADLARMAHEETGFGRVDSKTEKNLFATRTLLGQIEGMRTCGIIDRSGPVWEVASPMGVVAALIPSTNPTSTALYKAIIAAKARCAIVMSPHPRSARSTAEALRVVAQAAYRAGAPEGLFGCLTEISLEGTNALLEHPDTDLIIATGGNAMVRAAYSKGKPAYGVGSGNVPVYVDRSADVEKAARDLVYGASFDWGTLCSTERSVIADMPIAAGLKTAMRSAGACFLNERETDALRSLVASGGRLNVAQVGQSPQRIAELAGFEVPASARVLVAEVEDIGPVEPLSMETLSPILSWYRADGWKEGCHACKRILAYGGMGHTLGLHAQKESVIVAFAEEKPAMRIVVNTVAALGSVGHTTSLFPAMTLGPGTFGGSITSDNISPLHLVQIKRVAFETHPIHEGAAAPQGSSPRAGQKSRRTPTGTSPWMEEIEARLRERAGSRPARAVAPQAAASPPPPQVAPAREVSPTAATSAVPLDEATIERLIATFSKT
ncbi:MAG: acetaldehyde dehydrogenase [Bacteroidetes bacterium CG12_big_fil_rev_8_21_14_0_65_60_17]|nr:MAG: acetaldehyde dehydrogenase [Bacteroidetes bacterium CG12_big_fil_rev_8_21_14_0_65_60_17]